MSSHRSIPYPWQQTQWQLFQEQLKIGRFPHALLICGVSGIGKRHFAKTVAEYLLCQSPKSELACGECRGCQLNRAQTHPDNRLITLEKSAKQINIGQIRRLSTLISETAQQGGRKVIIFEPIEALNLNAASALLKNLEEPPPNTFFLLISHRVNSVLATIRSRCQLLKMTLPQRASAITWLKDLGYDKDLGAILDMAAGAPLQAQFLLEEENLQPLTRFYDDLLELQESPVILIKSVNQWKSIELSLILDWWFLLIHSLVSGHPDNRSTSSSPRLDFLKTISTIKTKAKSFNRQWLFRFSDKLLQAKQQILSGTNPNPQLLLEELVLDWYAIIKAVK